LTVLVTGGAGFIGSNFVLDWFESTDEPVINLDALTDTGNEANLARLAGDARHLFVHGNVCDSGLLGRLLAEHRPRAVIHFAAESHVDRSIRDPALFMRSNVEGTFRLLQAARALHERLPAGERDAFRFCHVSTDEVYGSLAPGSAGFAEDHPLRPNSPYSASKAASDHLVRAWHCTYGLPVVTSNCSNNYGPLQFPEKLIPLTISHALAGRPLPLYGDGLFVRDWLYVRDHCRAIRSLLARGRPGETYNIGGWNQKTNLEVVHAICALLDELRPDPAGPHRRLITFVADRPGHDRRYAIDARKVERETGWRPEESFDSGLAKTVHWYLGNAEWVAEAGRRVQHKPGS
jgi:dTDP-glucose 4,6-dehydratase